MVLRVGDSSTPSPRVCSLTLCWRWATAGLICLCLTAAAHSAVESDCSLSSVTEGIQKGIIIKRSDDPIANHAMYLERKMLLQEFHLFPTFYFMSGKGSTNACAFPDGDPDRGVVTFGEELLRKEVSDAGGPEYASSVPAIMAHEFAHLLQIQNGSTLVGPKYELQADYIAGWYVGRRAKWVPMSSSQRSLQTIMRSVYSKGDYEINDSSHHGTPDERVAAISAGYSNSQLQMRDIYRESLKFVSPTRDSSPACGERDPLRSVGIVRGAGGNNDSSAQQVCRFARCIGRGQQIDMDRYNEVAKCY